MHPFVAGDFTNLFQVGDVVHQAIDSSNQRRRYSQVYSINRSCIRLCLLFLHVFLARNLHMPCFAS
jgi:hypothetical protein